MVFDDSGNRATYLKKHLDRNGWSFQYSVFKSVRELHFQKKSQFAVLASEFPVAVGENNTHIDFILRPPEQKFTLVVECKRRPLNSEWLFVKAPFVADSAYEDQTIVDRIEFDPSFIRRRIWTRAVGIGVFDKSIYHLAFERKPKQNDLPDKEPKFKPQMAIDQAVLGASGLVNYYNEPTNASNEYLYSEPPEIDILPVVVTNAPIFVTNVDISTADLKAGEIPQIDPKFISPKPYVCFQCAVSPFRRHSADRALRLMDNLTHELLAEFHRSVIIVNADCLEEFSCKLPLEFANAIDMTTHRAVD